VRSEDACRSKYETKVGGSSRLELEELVFVADKLSEVTGEFVVPLLLVDDVDAL
jgi:hypothetical protein